ncbi:MAG TPA: hypothetical protein PLK55_03285 [archaeon]|jgi:thioredoxin-related protein|nr:hypothetical protein [archaeon]HOZ35980.1 hypothetical protein [archaeon]
MKKKIQTKISKYEEKKKTNFFSKNNRVKIIIWVLAILCVLLIITFSLKYLNNNNAETNTQETMPELGINEETENPNLETTPVIISGEITKSSKLEDFYATSKPSFIVFAGTYCGHCQKLLPELEKEIWNNYSNKANIWVEIIGDGEFPVAMPQGVNSNIIYEEIMGDCRYVPAYVVLDKEGNQILRSCGSEKTIAEIKAALDSQLN